MAIKKKIVIAYPAMMLGGSTTSLLSILRRLDYECYEVDLLLDTHTGEWMGQIPKQVNLLPPAYKYPNNNVRRLRNIFTPMYWMAVIKSRTIVKKTHQPCHAVQYIEMKDTWTYRKIEKEYDFAIAFLEGRQCKLVAKNIKARKKIAWIHIDYKDSKFSPEYDYESMRIFDRIILVSKKCKQSFEQLFPTLKDRTCVIENILSQQHIQNLGNEKCKLQVDDNYLNLVTTCRIAFKSKGLDRAVSVMERLKEEGVLKNLRWYILGDGSDMEKLREMITLAGLSEHIFLLGMKKNPYKYLKDMSLFFLPSRWEGKPMAVTEAFMMGLPALVTEYSSAKEQIREDIDGHIVENSVDGIYIGLKYIIENKEKINQWKKNVRGTDYTNTSEFEKVIKLFLEN